MKDHLLDFCKPPLPLVNKCDHLANPLLPQMITVAIRERCRVVYKTRDILTTHDLRQKIAQHLDVPESELEAFIPFSEVLDDDEEEDPRFHLRTHSGEKSFLSNQCPKAFSEG